MATEQNTEAPAHSSMRSVPAPSYRPLRFRALAAGTLAAALTAVLVTQAEMVLSTVRIGYLQFPPAALALLLIAMAVSRGLKRLSDRFGFSSADLLVIYCMALVAAMVSSHGVAQKLVPLLVIPRYYADHTNNWSQLYDPHIPRALVPYNPQDPRPQAVVENYYHQMPLSACLPHNARDEQTKRGS